MKRTRVTQLPGVHIEVAPTPVRITVSITRHKYEKYWWLSIGDTKMPDDPLGFPVYIPEQIGRVYVRDLEILHGKENVSVHNESGDPNSIFGLPETKEA